MIGSLPPKERRRADHDIVGSGNMKRDPVAT